MMEIKEGYSREEAVKSLMFTFAVLHYQGESIRKTLEFSVGFLKDMYERTHNPKLMELVELELTAFLLMGFPLPQDEEIRDMMKKAEIREFAQSCRLGKRVGVSKSQIRSLIGKWKPSKKCPMTKGDVVEDIIAKISRREIGTWRYTYQRAHTRKSEREEYELVITQEEMFFWDLNQFRFYTFDEGGEKKTND